MWVLDRKTFNHIVKDASMRKREKYEDFLKSVNLLANMDHYERLKLSDALKEEKFQEGDFIIKQGEEGNVFYMLMEGECEATKGEPAQVVMKYKVGDYFGELALLKNEPRAANVVAKSKVKVASLNRDSFMRLLGPLEDILKRNLQAYMNYC